jgi:hypothetical protein
MRQRPTGLPQYHHLTQEKKKGEHDISSQHAHNEQRKQQKQQQQEADTSHTF